jgi:transcriptional regulator with XRE-family HTH domain
MAKVTDLHRRWRGDPAYAEAFDALAGEFELAQVLIATRARAGLSQAELAARMKTSQSYVARLESGRVQPSSDALARFAKATGTTLRISFEPVAGKASRRAPTRAEVLGRLQGQPTRKLKRGAAEILRAERDAR